MWMIIFLLLPLLGIAYIAWHVWCLLPCAWWWRVSAIVLLAGSFLTMMFGMRGLYDRMPLPVGTALYEIGTSSVFVMMYLVILFFVLDLARLCHIIPRTFLYNNWYTALGITILMVGVFVYGNLHYTQISSGTDADLQPSSGTSPETCYGQRPPHWLSQSSHGTPSLG